MLSRRITIATAEALDRSDWTRPWTLELLTRPGGNELSSYDSVLLYLARFNATLVT